MSAMSNGPRAPSASASVDRSAAESFKSIPGSGPRPPTFVSVREGVSCYFDTLREGAQLDRRRR